jgi:prepilin-type N-terminal cleavage/methylation domain-containing protein
MKISPDQSNRRRAAISGFTLMEMMIALMVFSLLIAAMVAIQIFGMRVYTLGATKLTATSGARKTLDVMRDQIRSAKIVYVGTYTAPSGPFNRVANGSLQMGNALAIGGLTNSITTNYTIYYLDNSQPTNLMCSVTNGMVTVLTKYVTNYYCFFAEDYQTNIVSNYNNNPVIHVVMQFDQWEYPLGFIGTNAVNAYAFYRIQARVARRAKQ